MADFEKCDPQLVVRVRGTDQQSLTLLVSYTITILYNYIYIICNIYI